MGSFAKFFTGTVKQFFKDREVQKYLRMYGGGSSSSVTPISFALGSGATWNGYERRALSANLEVNTDGAASSGIMLIENAASYTLEVNGTAITIRNSGSNGGRTTVSYVTDDQGYVWVTSDADNLPIKTTTPLPPLDAPTAGVTDDTANTFDFTYNPLYTNVTDYEYTLDGGSTYSDLSAKPLVVGDITKAPGLVGVRVKEIIGVGSASATLYDADGFTTPIQLLSNAFPAGWDTLPIGIGNWNPNTEIYETTGTLENLIVTGGTIDHFKICMYNSVSGLDWTRCWINIWRGASNNATLIGSFDSGILSIQPGGIVTVNQGTPFAVQAGDRISVGYDCPSPNQVPVRTGYGGAYETTASPVTTTPKDWTSPGGGTVAGYIPVEIYGTP